MTRYDKLFVGSSPISVMHVVRQARLGHRVVLLESELASELGGARKMKSVEGIGRVECACHLIEWSDFVRLKRQPVKIHNDGRRVLLVRCTVS